MLVCDSGKVQKSSQLLGAPSCYSDTMTQNADQQVKCSRGPRQNGREKQFEAQQDEIHKVAKQKDQTQTSEI